MFENFKKKIAGLLWGTDEKDVLLKKIEDLLISNEVSYEATQYILENLKKNKILATKNYLSEELKNICNIGQEKSLDFSTIVLIGPNGGGKTSFAVKLAKYLEKQGKKVSLFTTDTVRSAAMEQLADSCRANKLNFVPINLSNSFDISLEILKIPAEVKIVDTEGITSDVTDVKRVLEILRPTEIFGVFNSTTGYSALKIANELKNFLTGIVLTSTEVDSKGGLFISLPFLLKKPIRFTSKGEKILDIEKFEPDRIVKRLLGEMDVEGAVEAFADVYNTKETEKFANKAQNSGLNYEDLRENLKKLMEMNVSWLMSVLNIKGDFRVDTLKKYVYMIDSMTIRERMKPDLFDKNMSRQMRVAKGSGTSVMEVQQLIMTRQLLNKNMKNLMSKDMSSIFSYFNKTTH